ncbi:MAG: efflux RND transporter periplasmic adaptor subunit [Planctomycetales bacterium]|nr:efflux RND transporter periplasmic adaptor subunit [Planctomycetales bacterium]
MNESFSNLVRRPAAGLWPPSRYFSRYVIRFALVFACTDAALVRADESSTDDVTVSAAKAAAAGITTTLAAERTLQESITAPGRIRYDDRRHVEVKVAAAGIVSSVDVKPGDAVKAGDLLAVIISPEVAQARAEVLSKTADCELARIKSQRAAAVQRGLTSLLDAIRAQTPPDEIAERLLDAELGDYRQSVLTKYSAFRQAAALVAGVADPSLAGVLPGREVQRRRAAYTAASADLQTALESSAYQAELDARAAANALADAERQAAIREQYLAALQGTGLSKATVASEASLSELLVRTPIDGVVQSRTYSASERVAPGDGLFVVADTSTLWVEADIREGQCGALALKTGDVVQVVSGSLPGRVLEARVHYAGGQVSAESNAASLVAVLDNPAGLLRPGQFVQVTVPVGPSRECIAVPTTAVVEHEGERFVFVQVGAGKFRRVDVETGIHQGDWVEVKSGLAVGDAVVATGAFTLKSELLMEQLDE